MTIEVLDMPDVTELPEDAGVQQRPQRKSGAAERTPTGHAVPASPARRTAARVWDPPPSRKRDGSE
jgi:hypothetical protein